jgi:hypothetical protein
MIMTDPDAFHLIVTWIWSINQVILQEIVSKDEVHRVIVSYSFSINFSF